MIIRFFLIPHLGIIINISIEEIYEYSVHIIVFIIHNLNENKNKLNDKNLL